MAHTSSAVSDVFEVMNYVRDTLFLVTMKDFH